MRRKSVKYQQPRSSSVRRKKPLLFFHQRSESFAANSRQPFFTPALQPKLTVNAPDDKYEREADRVADAVMRMPDTQVQQQTISNEKVENRKGIQTQSKNLAPFPITITCGLGRSLQRQEEQGQDKNQQIPYIPIPALPPRYSYLSPLNYTLPLQNPEYTTPLIDYLALNQVLLKRGLSPNLYSSSVTELWKQQYLFYQRLRMDSVFQNTAFGDMLNTFGVTPPQGDWNAWLANATTPMAVDSSLSYDFPTLNEQLERKYGISAGTFINLPAIHFKLKANNPDNKYEREADRVADAVMSMADPQVQMVPETRQTQQMCPRCQQRARQGKALDCPDCEKKLQMSSLIQKRGYEHSYASPEIMNELQTSKGQGISLPTVVQREMANKISADFSDVNIHTDSKSYQLNQQLGAKAFTYGSDIYFNKGEYNPTSKGGKRLLVHELTHVVQQLSPDYTSEKSVMRKAKVESEFSGCTGRQASQINSVVQDAKKALNKATAVVATTWGGSRSLSAYRRLFMAHFHTTNHDDLRRILGTFISIERAFGKGLEFECETTCPKTKTTSVCGYAYNTMWFGGFGPIHICFDTSGCDFKTTAAPNQIALVIHEAAHRHTGVDDKAYRWEKKYNSLSSEEAMDNADSYAWFAVLL